MTIPVIARAAANPLNAVVAAACLYESAAILSGKTPTISQICRQRRWVEVALLGSLAIHLHDEVVRAAAQNRRRNASGQ